MPMRATAFPEPSGAPPDCATLVFHPMSAIQRTVEKYFAGIGIDLTDRRRIVIHDTRFYGQVLGKGFLGLAESYMAGYWDAPKLDDLLTDVFLGRFDQKVVISPEVIWANLFAKIVNLQSTGRAFDVGRRHYDIGNDLYRAMLDKGMSYTCGYWRNDARTLEEAQEHKLDLICRKLGLQPGMRVLDIGSGWGNFARHACARYGVSVEGYTISVEQKKLADELNAGLPAVTHLRDYREITGQFDRVVSIGMLEHVGYRNIPTFFAKVADALKPDGIALVHTLGSNYSQTSGNVFINKYIFPGGMASSIAQVGQAIERRLVLEDLHNFGPDYDRTLREWHHRFTAAWPQLRDRYSETFRRMWEFYLLGAAACFRAREIQLWQFVFTKPGTRQPDVRKS